MKKVWLVLAIILINKSLISQRADGNSPTLYNGIGTFQRVSVETGIVQRKGSEELKQDFPQIRSQIDVHCREGKQRCKTEEGLIDLFSRIKLNEVIENKKAF